MPITRSAKKANRASQNKRAFNVRRKRELKDAIKTTQKLIAEGKLEAADKNLSVAFKAIDKAAKRKVIKGNTAARMKSRLSKATAKKKAAK